MQKDIFGVALKDYQEGNYSEDITVIARDFDDDHIPIPYLFRDYDEMPSLEKKALDMSSGKILDIGCGAGSHSLYLQQQDLEVMAIDISEGAIAVCEKRGVHHAKAQDIYHLKEGVFDTILLLMNGSGIIGKLENIPDFLNHIKPLLTPNGQILMDSSNIAYLFEDEDGGFWTDVTKGYYGEMRYQLNYKNQSSDWFDWLYVDFQTLQETSNHYGWQCELIQEGEHYEYLAKLSLL